MANVTGVITDAGRAKLALAFKGTGPFDAISYFKVGEGGWTNPGSGRIQKTPDPALTDLDLIENPGSYPGGLLTFTKTLTASDITIVSSTIVKCRLFLDQTEFNGTGTTEIWEAGLFDADDVMIAYGTFPIGQTKSIAIQIENYIQLLL